jgi:nitrite reductase/ring-hydroxylating ferredoxin subunit
MRDSVRVSVESDYEEKSVRIRDDTGKVTAGEATFRFSIDGADLDDAGADDSRGTENRPYDETADLDDGRDPCYIAPVTEIPLDSTLRCEAINGRHSMEIILRRENETDVFAWQNSCPHKPEVLLDPGGGAIVDDDQIVCHEHGARFECGDGVCTYGPCHGDALDEIGVEVRDGDVYLTDERFDACNRLS